MYLYSQVVTNLVYVTTNLNRPLYPLDTCKYSTIIFLVKIGLGELGKTLTRCN